MGYFLRAVIQDAERVCNSKKLPDLDISLLTIDGNRPLTKLRVLYDNHMVANFAQFHVLKAIKFLYLTVIFLWL